MSTEIAMNNIPYAFGFAAIDLLQNFIVGSMPDVIMESSTLALMGKAAVTGLGDASRFTYYEGYDKTA
jgi:hypothetical protein